MLWDDEEYNNTEEQLTIGANIRSIMVPSGRDWWVDTYRKDNCFVTEASASYNIRSYHQNTIGKNDCIDIETFYESINSIKFG